MTTLLQINSSLQPTGHATQLADTFVSGWHKADPTVRVVKRDLALEPVPHLTAERFAAFGAKPETRTAEQTAVLAESDRLIDELRAADVIVLGLPMYNFSVPSTLKAYFDHIARAGVTFRYTPEGNAEGLLKGKKAYVFVTRGGYYPAESDMHSVYVRYFLAFLGITDVEFVYAEGLAIDAATREQALARAHAEANALATRQLPLAA